MNTPLFIARRIGGSKPGNAYTPLIKKISITSIALGLAVMIISVSVVTGFQGEISDKVTGFGSHIQITNYDYNISFEARPVSSRQDFIPDLADIEGIRHVQSFATKPGIIKTDEDIHGIILKGVDHGFDWSFFSRRITEGSIIDISDTLRSDQVIISSLVSRRLRLNTGDDLFIYFIQDPPRIRRLTVSGIYDTGLEELDRIFIIGDIRHVQALNNWESDQVGGFEVLVSDFGSLQRIKNEILEILPYDLEARSIRELYPQIFDWLSLLDMNVYVIITLMILVAGINMITTLLISVLEKTNAIGILKAVGGSNRVIRKIFLYHAGILITKGMIIGNILGLAIIFIQHNWGVVSLSPESYYVSEVPVNIELVHILALNAGTFILSMAMLIVPSFIVTRISPVRAMTFR